MSDSLVKHLTDSLDQIHSNVTAHDSLVDSALRKYLIDETQWWNEGWFSTAVGVVGVLLGIIVSTWIESYRRREKERIERKEKTLESIGKIISKINVLIPRITKESSELYDHSWEYYYIDNHTAKSYQAEHLPPLREKIRDKTNDVREQMRSFVELMHEFISIAKVGDQVIHRLSHNVDHWSINRLTSDINFPSMYEAERVEAKSLGLFKEIKHLELSILFPIRAYIAVYYNLYVQDRQHEEIKLEFIEAKEAKSRP